jgi:hypothetical protein
MLRLRLLWRCLVIVLLTSCLAGRALGQEKKDEKEPAKGQRVFYTGHSFHFFVPPLVKEMAAAAGIKDHVQVGMSAIGGSRVIQHWDAPEEKFKTKEALRSGKVDVLTLAPIHLPDEGIENFTKLALEHNPNIRITVQESWMPFDIYDKTFTVRPKTVDHDAPTIEELRKIHKQYFEDMEEHVRALNKKYGKGKDVLFIAPIGQAVLKLRAKILAGEAPGLKKQSDLFSDPIGHAKAPLQLLVGYCYFAMIYQQSPVGLPAPAALGKGDDAKALNRLLQEIAWETVTGHPLSGVK